MRKPCLKLLVAVFAAVASPAWASDEDVVKQKLTGAGYTAVRELEYEGGLWEAEVTRADGSRGDVHVEAARGEIYDGKSGRPTLDSTAIRAKLDSLGFTDVGDLEREGAIWEAEAKAADGSRVDLRISGYDGHVIHQEKDPD